MRKKIKITLFSLLAALTIGAFSIEFLGNSHSSVSQDGKIPNSPMYLSQDGKIPNSPIFYAADRDGKIPTSPALLADRDGKIPT